MAGHLDCQREDGGIEVPLHSTSEKTVYLDTSYETDYINPAVLEAEVAGHLDCKRDIDEDRDWNRSSVICIYLPWTAYTLFATTNNSRQPIKFHKTKQFMHFLQVGLWSRSQDFHTK